jgi:hypothetical protein
MVVKVLRAELVRSLPNYLGERERDRGSQYQPSNFRECRYIYHDTQIRTGILASQALTMPVDQLLSTLLRSLQTWTDQQDTPRYASPAQATDLDN